MKTFNLGDKVFCYDGNQIIQGEIIEVSDDKYIYDIELSSENDKSLYKSLRTHWFDLYSSIWDIFRIIDDKIDNLTSQKNYWKERIHCESCHNTNRPREFEPCKSCENYENWRP